MKNMRSTYKHSNLIIDHNKNPSKRAKIDNGHTFDNTEKPRLLENTSTPNNTHTKNLKSIEVPCNVGILSMPSLKDLERMFETSDDSSDTNSIVKNDMQFELATSITETPIIPTIDLVDFSTQNQTNNPPISPGNINNYENDCDQLPPTELLELVTANHPIQQNNEDVKFCKTDWDTFDNRAQANRLDPKLLKVNEVNANSSNSNKTVENNLSLNSTFSPLPSTSQDNITIIKNDELFHNSLKEIQECKFKNTTIEVLDVNENTVIRNKKAYNNYDDDDCIIIENDSEPLIKHKYNNISDYICRTEKSDFQTQSEPPKPCDSIIEINTNSINHNIKSNSTTTMDDEIIDIDALIFNNQSVLQKYEQSQTNKKCNTKVVDVSFISDKPEKVIKRQSETQTKITQANNQQTSNAPTININSNISPDFQKQIEHEVKTFFERFYNNRNSKTSQTQSSLPHSSLSRTSKKKDRTGNLENTQTEVIDISETGMNNSTSNRNNIHGSVTTSTTFRPIQINYNPIQNISLDFTPLFPATKHHSTTHNATRNKIRGQTKIEDIILVSESFPNNSRNIHNNQSNTNSQHIRNNVACTLPKISSPLKKKQTQSTTGDEPSKNLGNCPICIDNLIGKTIVSTICGHVFCEQCLERALKTNKRCPTCRKQIKNNGYHKIFL